MNKLSIYIVRKMSQLFELLSQIRNIALLDLKKIVSRKFIKSYFLPAMLFLLIIGFFWATEYHELKRLLHKFLIFPALISLQLADYRRLYKLIPARCFVLFLGYLCLSLSWSSHVPGDIFFEYILYGFYILSFVIITIVTTQYNHKWLLLIGPGLIVVVITHILIASWFWYKVHPLTDRLEGPGIFNQSIQLATMYSAIAAFCMVSYLRGQDKMSTIYLLPLFICLGGIILTGSRGPLLTFLLVATVAALLIRNRRGRILFALMSFTGLIFVVIEPSLFHSLLERGTSYRPEIWAKAWHKITESWIFGYGIATSPELMLDDRKEIHHYHNIFLATWLYGGIVGVLLLLLLIVTTLVQGLRVPSAWPWLAAFISSLLCLSTNGNRLIYSFRPEWFYFWLPFAMILANLDVESSGRNSVQSTSQATE